MKALILPKHTNKELIRQLHRVYIREEFSTFVHRLSVVLRNPRVQSQESTLVLFTLLNRTFIYNVYKYIESGNYAQFIRVVGNATFGWDMVVNNRDIYDYVVSFTGLAVGDIDRAEMENFVLKELYIFMSNSYVNDSANFNVVLLDVFENLQRYVPVEQIQVMRIELTSDLSPIVFYHPKQETISYASTVS